MKKILSIILTVMLMATMLVGCSNKAADNGGLKNGATLKDIVAKINEEMQMSKAMEIDDTTLTDIYGVNKDDVVQYAGEMSMTMTSADTFIIIEAKEGKVDAVKEALEARRQTIIQAQYLPGEMEKANAGKAYVVNGNYVALIVAGDSMAEDYNSEYAQSETKRAEDIINSFFN